LPTFRRLNLKFILCFSFRVCIGLCFERTTGEVGACAPPWAIGAVDRESSESALIRNITCFLVARKKARITTFHKPRRSPSLSENRCPKSLLQTLRKLLTTNSLQSHFEPLHFFKSCKEFSDVRNFWFTKCRFCINLDKIIAMLLI
jgi:hypothetical protein